MTKTLSLIFIFFCWQGFAQTCIVHRTHIEGALENSLEGLSLVQRLGVSGVEFDIQMTKDGQPIIYHNPRLKEHIVGHRCPIGKKVEDLNLSEIRENCFLVNGERVPLLGEGLEVLKDFEGHLFVELKKIPSLKFFEEIEKRGLQNSPQLKILSFKKRALKEVHKRWGKTKTLLLSLIIPRGLFFHNVAFNKHLRIFIPFFRSLKKKVGLWTVNKKKEILKAVSKKADFIITDEYQMCREALTQI